MDDGLWMVNYGNPFLENRFRKTVVGKPLFWKMTFYESIFGWSKKNPHVKWSRTVPELIQTDKQASSYEHFLFQHKNDGSPWSMVHGLAWKKAPQNIKTSVFQKNTFYKNIFWWSKKNPHEKWCRTVPELIQTDEQASRHENFFQNRN